LLGADLDRRLPKSAANGERGEQAGKHVRHDHFNVNDSRSGHSGVKTGSRDARVTGGSG
jgi:hypothetical protein